MLLFKKHVLMDLLPYYGLGGCGSNNSNQEKKKELTLAEQLKEFKNNEKPPTKFTQYPL